MSTVKKKYCVKNGDKILYKIDLCHTQGRQQGGGAGGHLPTLISKSHFSPFPFWRLPLQLKQTVDAFGYMLKAFK